MLTPEQRAVLTDNERTLLEEIMPPLLDPWRDNPAVMTTLSIAIETWFDILNDARLEVKRLRVAVQQWFDREELALSWSEVKAIEQFFADTSPCPDFIDEAVREGGSDGR